jgi:hypothetical protein
MKQTASSAGPITNLGHVTRVDPFVGQGTQRRDFILLLGGES